MNGTTINVGINLRDFNSGMKQVKGGLGGLAKTTGKAFAAVGAAVVGVGLASLRAGEDANGALGAIAAQTGQTQDELRGTEDAVRRLSRTTGAFTAQGMREALASVSRYGQDTAHQTHMLESAMRLAQQSGKGLGTSIYNLDALMVKFNAPLENAIKFTNMFATAQGLAGVSQANLTKGLQKAAPTVNASGLAYYFVAGALSQAYLEGLNMTQASSGLANIFDEMRDPASNMAEVLQTIGVRTRYANGELRDQETVMWEMISALDGLNPKARDYLIAQMQLTKYGTAMLDIFNQSEDSVNELSAAFEYGMKAGYDYERALHMIEQRSGGFGEAFQLKRNKIRNVLYAINDIIGSRFYEWMLEATGKLGDFIDQAKESGVIEQVAEAVVRIAEATFDLGKKLAPVVAQWLPKLIDVTVKASEFLGDNAEAVGKVVGAFILWKKVAKPVIAIGGGLKTMFFTLGGKKAIGKIAPAMKTAVGKPSGGGVLGGAKKMAKAMGPKGWAALAVGAGAIATIGWFRKTDEEGNSRWANMTNAIGEYASSLRDDVSERMSDLRDATTERFTDIRERATNRMGEMRDSVTERVDEMARDGLRRFQEWTGLTDDEIQQARDNVSEAVAEMRDNAVERITDLRYRASNQMNEMRDDLRERATEMRDDATERFETLRYNANKRFENMRTQIGEAVAEMRYDVNERFQNMRDNVTESVTTLVNNARERFEGSRLQEVAQNITDGIQERFELAGNRASEWGRAIGEGVRNGIEERRERIRNTVDSIGTMVGNTFRNIMGINSPSRVTKKIGEQTGEGKEIGLLNTVKDIQRAAVTLGNITIESMLNTGTPPKPTALQTHRAERDTSTNTDTPQSAVINVYVGNKQIAHEIVDDITKEQHIRTNKHQQFNGRMVTRFE